MDSLCFLAFAAGAMKLHLSSMFGFYACAGLMLLLVFCYLVLAPVRWGGTPGKLLFKTRITRVDGAPAKFGTIATRQALLHAPTLVTFMYLLYAGTPFTEPGFSAADWTGRGISPESYVDTLPGKQALEFIRDGWLAVGLATLLSNRKRRAAHDFLAGTVVVVVGNTPVASARSAQY